MEKGDMVLVTKSVYTKKKVYRQLGLIEREILRTPDKPPKNIQQGWARPLCRVTHDKPFRGLVVGWSTRISGSYHPGSSYIISEPEPGYLSDMIWHKVIMIQPLDTKQWCNPIPCLESDLSTPLTVEEWLMIRDLKQDVELLDDDQEA